MLRPLPLKKAISDAMLGIKGAGVVDEKQTVGGRTPPSSLQGCIHGVSVFIQTPKRQARILVNRAPQATHGAWPPVPDDAPSQVPACYLA